MSSLSNAGADLAVKAALGIAPAGTRWLALCTSAPDDATVGAEIATPGADGYDRQVVAFGAPTDVSGARTCANTAALNFGPFSADLASATHVMLCDHATDDTAAHMVAWAALDTARDPADGDMIQFAIGDLAWSVD